MSETNTSAAEAGPDSWGSAEPPADTADGPENAPERPTGAGGEPARLRELEREGDIAADYLEELLDIADLDGDLDMDVEGDRASVSVVGDKLDMLVGDHGKVLESLQELARLAVYRETGQRSRLMLDVGGYRARRRTELLSLVADTVDAVRSGGEPVKLSPMTPFERKVVHDAVAEAGLVSDSEGEEPERCVVVRPGS